MAKKRKKKSTVAPGDSFAVPLEGGRYAVCRVLKINDNDLVLIANADWIGTEVPRR